MRLTIKQAASRLRVSTTYVYRLLKEGKLIYDDGITKESYELFRATRKKPGRPRGTFKNTDSTKSTPSVQVARD